jgi:hypothetical protein
LCGINCDFPSFRQWLFERVSWNIWYEFILAEEVVVVGAEYIIGLSHVQTVVGLIEISDESEHWVSQSIISFRLVADDRHVKGARVASGWEVALPDPA